MKAVININASLLIFILSLATLSFAGEEGTASVERRFTVMGTSLVITVEAVDRPTALAASERAIRALIETEARLSTWRKDTELARFNRSKVGVPFELSEELASELQTAGYWCRVTEGAFDPAIGLLVEAWGLRTGGRIPELSERQAALKYGGMDSLKLTGRKAVRPHRGFRIEEGGFGKGAGLDNALESVAGDGVIRATMNLGGQVAVMGTGEPFYFGVASPRERERPVLRLMIDRGAVATTGNSERSIEVNGVRYSHILDPRSGESKVDFGTLTIWAEDSITADCLSTGLYVMGPEQALVWASNRPGVEALVLEPDAGGFRARATMGLAGRFRDLDEQVYLEFFPRLERRVVE